MCITCSNRVPQVQRKFLVIPVSLDAGWKELNPHEKHKRICKYDVTTALGEMGMTYKEFAKSLKILRGQCTNDAEYLSHLSGQVNGGGIAQMRLMKKCRSVRAEFLGHPPDKDISVGASVPSSSGAAAACVGGASGGGGDGDDDADDDDTQESSEDEDDDNDSPAADENEEEEVAAPRRKLGRWASARPGLEQVQDVLNVYCMCLTCELQVYYVCYLCVI